MVILDKINKYYSSGGEKIHVIDNVSAIGTWIDCPRDSILSAYFCNLANMLSIHIIKNDTNICISPFP